MQKINLSLNIILVIAVAILFYLVMKQPEVKIAMPVSKAMSTQALQQSNAIVFINSDSLATGFLFYKDAEERFENKQRQLEGSLKSMSDKIKLDAENYQRQAEGMTDEQRMTKENELMQRQEQLMQQRDDMLKKLEDEQLKFSEDLHKKLTSFLRTFAAQNNFSYVLGYQKSGGILFANDSLDVTQDVISGLNAAYPLTK